MPYTQARGAADLNAGGVRVDLRIRNHPFPVLAPEAAADGSQAIRPDKTLPPWSAHQKVEDVVGLRSAMQVGDVPAQPRGRVHPLQQLDDLRLGEVMEDATRCHQVHALCLRRSAHVSEHPLDTAADRRRLTRGTQGVRIDVHTDEFHLNAAPLRPLLNQPQHVSVTAPNIDQPELALRVQPMRLGQYALQPPQRMLVCPRKPIDDGQMPQTPAQLLIAARPIHLFLDLGALREI